MAGVFRARPDTRPFAAERPRVDLDERNPAHSATAARPACLRFDEPDAIDDDELNDILWQAMRGTSAPVHSYFSR